MYPTFAPASFVSSAVIGNPPGGLTIADQGTAGWCFRAWVSPADGRALCLVAAQYRHEDPPDWAGRFVGIPRASKHICALVGLAR